jgi:AraC family transcriptional regulator
MKALQTGNYLSTTQRSVNYNGLIISDTEYINQQAFPVHYHENLYIAYVVKGHYTEETKKNKTRCLPGTVVFHNVCEEHSNSGFSGYSRIINLEIQNKWLEGHDISPNELEGNIKSNTIDIQCCMNRVAEEYLNTDDASQLEIESSVMKILANILSIGSIYSNGIPKWVKVTKELLHENNTGSLNLKFISETSGVHPVHISRDFPRYFNASFSDYIRKVRIGKARAMLADDSMPLSAIAVDCGFSDQSHFIRVFRKFTGVTPLEYRRLIYTFVNAR